MITSFRSFLLMLAASMLPCLPAAAQLEPSAAQQVSVGLGSTAPDSNSSGAVVAPNRDVVVFQSDSTNLVRNDTNASTDIFQRASSGAITRLSVSDSEEEANDMSERPAISQAEPDGTYAVAFVSRATNLVNKGPVEVRYKQVFVRIPKTGKTFLVSRGVQGGYGDGDSFDPSIVSVEAGAKYMVAFSSRAHNISDDGGVNGPSAVAQIMVAFVTADGDVVKIRTMRAPGGVIPNGDMLSPRFSGNGEKMVFVTTASNFGWANPMGYQQIVLATRQNSVFRLLSRSATGDPGNQSSNVPSITFDGSKVAFRTTAPNIFNSSASSPTYVLYTVGESDLTVLNTDSKGVRRESSNMTWVNIDPGGRLVAFHSGASDLVAGDSNDFDDVFVKDLQTDAVIIAAKNSRGEQPNGESNECFLGGTSFNGSTLNLSYASNAQNLGSLTSPDHAQVFRTTLTFPPPPLAPDTELQSPPDVQAKPKQVIVTLQKFAGVSFSGIKSFWRGEGAVEGLATKITYDVRLTNSTTKKVQKTTSSRNRVAFRNLTPGKYTVKYRATATSSSKKKITTKFSPSQSVVVKSS